MLVTNPRTRDTWTTSVVFGVTQLMKPTRYTYDSSIDFILEAGDNTFCSLHLKISLDDHGNILMANFAIHRKDSSSGISIHNDSLHPLVNKMPAVNSAIHRLTNLPFTPATTKEQIHHIEKIVEINEISVNVRLLALRKRLRQILS